MGWLLILASVYDDKGGEIVRSGRALAGTAREAKAKHVIDARQDR